MAKITLTKARPTINSKPPQRTTNPLKISEEEFEWAKAMCTHATFLSAGVQKRINEKLHRVAYLSVRPAMEGALKSLWVMGRVKRDSIPDDLKQLVACVEEVFPKFNDLFSLQMKFKDKFGMMGIVRSTDGPTLTLKCGTDTGMAKK